MDQSWYSSVAHGNLPVWNPVAPGHLQEYVSRLSLSGDSVVLDIGCGRGYLLSRVLSQFPARGIGVDCSTHAMAHAARDLARFVAAGRLTLNTRTFTEAEYLGARFDLAACIGATHALGGYRETLQAARRLLRPRGMLLVGEGYWKRTPAAEYLAFLKSSPDEHTSHTGNQSLGASEGFELVACSACSPEEWDAYEQQYADNVERYARANPHHPDALAMLARIWPWREAYLRWGRDTLGFGLYLFRLPAEAGQPPTR